MRHRMVLDKDVEVPMRDGSALRANVFRPDADGKFPVLMTLGPYGKDVHISQFMPEAWEYLVKLHAGQGRESYLLLPVLPAP